MMRKSQACSKFTHAGANQLPKSYLCQTASREEAENEESIKIGHMVENYQRSESLSCLQVFPSLDLWQHEEPKPQQNLAPEAQYWQEQHSPPPENVTSSLTSICQSALDFLRKAGTVRNFEFQGECMPSCRF